LLTAYPNDNSISEGNLNWQGFNSLNNGKTKLALDILKVNMLLYPTRASVYDSYGEALALSGDTVQAIVNYKKALSIEPKKESAVKALAELKAKKK
jgi:Flp pilus assembly protein TadD